MGIREDISALHELIEKTSLKPLTVVRVERVHQTVYGITADDTVAWVMPLKTYDALCKNGDSVEPVRPISAV